MTYTVSSGTLNSSIAYHTIYLLKNTTLLIVYYWTINDIGNAVPNLAIKLFADDTNLFIFDEDVSLPFQQIESLSVFKNHLRYHLLLNT